MNTILINLPVLWLLLRRDRDQSAPEALARGKSRSNLRIED